MNDDTPRTNVVSEDLSQGKLRHIVPSDFARTLERELHEAKKTNPDWKEAAEVAILQRDEWKECASMIETITCTCYLAEDGAGGQDSTGKVWFKPQTKIVCNRCKALVRFNQLSKCQ